MRGQAQDLPLQGFFGDKITEIFIETSSNRTYREWNCQ